MSKYCTKHRHKNKRFPNVCPSPEAGFSKEAGPDSQAGLAKAGIDFSAAGARLFSVPQTGYSVMILI